MAAASAAARGEERVASASASPSPSMREFEEALSTFLSHLDTSSPAVDLSNVDDDDDEAGRAQAIAENGGGSASLDEQLRQYVSAVHDCPHCECCSGSLLVV